ncbi:hypothetical protein R1flu_010371 [Riccia fluitans]|uniref:Uncharacterized protein n=1 Tax=Riccia fluitans TaxID=41844 RepID=A0ABD1Z7A5_9MARC
MMVPVRRILQNALIEIEAIAPRCTTDQLENWKFNRDAVLNWHEALMIAEARFPQSFSNSLIPDLDESPRFEISTSGNLSHPFPLNLVPTASPTAWQSIACPAA